jgi:FAD/FMN-containing dehydrogenase
MDILGIDTDRRVVRCEPLVTVQRLVEALVPKGWIVPIVPEIGDLTVGGLVSILKIFFICPSK